MRNALIAIAVMGVALLAAFAGFKLTGWRLTREQERTEQLSDTSAAQTLTIDGTRELTAAADQLATAATRLRSATNAQDRAAYADPLASDVLPPSVLDRVRADDDRLCASGPQCAGRAAEAGVSR